MKLKDRDSLGRLLLSAVALTIVLQVVASPAACADDTKAKVGEAIQILSTSTETQKDRIAASLDLIQKCPQGEALPALIEYLGDSTATRRRAAIYAIQLTVWIDPKPAFAPLRNLFTHQEDLTRGMSALALATIGDESSFDALVKMLHLDESAYAQRCAAWALGELGLQKAKPELEKAIPKGEPMVTANARNALDRLAFLESNARLDGPAAKARQGIWLISGSTVDEELRLQRAIELIKQCPDDQRKELLERWSKSDSEAIKNSVIVARKRLAQ